MCEGGAAGVRIMGSDNEVSGLKLTTEPACLLDPEAVGRRVPCQRHHLGQV